MESKIETMIDIEDIYLKTSLIEEHGDADYRAILNVTTTLMNKDQLAKPLKIYVSLIDVVNRNVDVIKADARMVAEDEALSTISIDIEIEQAILWSPNNPYLYQVVVEVTDHYDTVLVQEELNHGFRTVTVQDQRLLINNKIAKIKETHLAYYEDGIDFEPDKENYVAYLKHLKECNVNAIWTGKELEDSLFYDLCDQYGFYLFEQMHSEVGSRLIHTHRNHPSIITWVIEESDLKAKDAIEHRNKMIEQDYTRPYSYKESVMPQMSFMEQPFEVEWHTESTTLAVTSIVDDYPKNATELWVLKTVDGETVEAVEVKDFKGFDEESYEGSSDLLKWKGEEGRYSHIAFEVRLAENTWWQKSGYVIASKTYAITEPTYKEIPLEHSGYCKVEDKAEGLIVKGQFGTIEISKVTGLMTSLMVQGQELLECPIRPNVWMDTVDRPESVENDFYWMVKGFKKDPWESAVESMTVKSVEHRMVNELAEIVAMAKVKGLSGLLKMTYVISNQGEFKITYEGIAAKPMHRIGMFATLAIECQQMNYFGEGPYGNVYHSAEAMRCKVHDVNLSGEFLSGTEQRYRDITWLTLNDESSLGIMFEQCGPERLSLCTESRDVTVESIKPPNKAESFSFAVKCLLLYE